MKKKIIIGATVAAIAIPTVAGLALASGWSHGMGRHHVAMDKMIKEIDLDANGSIARDELAKWQVQQVTNFDGNDDG
ncbi:MAG: hypothetical protein R3261_02325, partial [Alphaproteobacteria bacterium]|nr:hypothetical protein [Alphaproteobacteria bacterium]